MKRLFAVLALVAAQQAIAIDDLYMNPSPKIYANDGTYLGNLNQNRYDPNSVSNPYGPHGSRYSPDSINNRYGEYGSPYSPQSPNFMHYGDDDGADETGE